MEEADESAEIWNGCRRGAFPDQNKRKRPEPSDDDSVELSLGLSLNGKFGLDPASKKLRRSSSVSNLFSATASGCQSRAGYAPLGRTCSLPAATDAWRRQKELASLRCTEARKKRMEKLKNGRVMKDKEIGAGDEGGGFEPIQPSSQGSTGSGSSGGSDLTVEGTKISVDQSSEETAVEKPVGMPTKGNSETPKNAMLDMPYVSTRGYGPNCRKIKGFLYRYRKGEDVKIVCVCHGLFLSPAEFVKHGGGGDVAQPLKHIVVNPFPLL